MGSGFPSSGGGFGHSFLGLELARPSCGWRLGCVGVRGVELSGWVSGWLLGRTGYGVLGVWIGGRGVLVRSLTSVQVFGWST